jgi:hypothetical protein
MTQKDPCEAWGDLIFDDSNRGKIYHYFDRNREALIEHLRHCKRCKNLIRQIMPLPRVFKRTTTPQDFAGLIRKLRKDSEGKNLKDPSLQDDSG